MEQVNGNQVKNILPRFIPGKEFKKALATVDFVKAPQNQ
jgi:hypothetical protein